MKKSSIAIAVAVFIVMLSGIIFLVHFVGKNGLTGINKANVQAGNNSTAGSSGSVSFGEFKYEITAEDVVSARYVKIGSTPKIYSLSPVKDTSVYDITSDGNRAVYLGKDGQIWALFNDGSSKQLTPDKYNSISKDDIHKKVPNYIWASEPMFESNGMVRFISDLPSSESDLKKSIWEINVTNGDMKMIYTLNTDSYKVLGYNEDGMFLVLDGNSLVSVDTEANTVKKLDTGDKQILNMSPSGTKMIYVKKNKSGTPDYSALYIMDSSGANSVKLPGIQGYAATPTGLWNSDSNEYAFIAKALWSGKDKIAVIEFDEDYTDIKSFAPEPDMRFPDNCRLSWSGGDSIAVDTGNDIVNVSLD